VLRTDAGFGGDANVNHALTAHWQLLAKGKGGKRPTAYATRIAPTDWQDLGQQRWIAPAPDAPHYVQPTQHALLRWQTERSQLKYSTLVTSVLDWSLAEMVAYYDDRGACETEIQADKRGLQLERRRKKQLAAQEALILLTDLAHNLLAWTMHWMFSTGPFAHFGPLRLTQDVLALPGRLRFEQDRLVEVHLNKRHPYAAEVAEALHRLLSHFAWP
jgi:hypothetical protein